LLIDENPAGLKPITRDRKVALKNIKVRQIMSDKIVSVPAQETVGKVALMMKQHGVGSVLVNDGTNPVGIVTETDIVQKVVAEELSPLSTKVNSIMSYPLMSVDADAVLAEAAETMEHNGIRHLAVMEKGRVKGIVSMRNLIRSVMESRKAKRS
jgi:signal-transduction protein with cAMP-binding, CBS, and nucleotidyltransferase domain